MSEEELLEGSFDEDEAIDSDDSPVASSELIDLHNKEYVSDNNKYRTS